MHSLNQWRFKLGKYDQDMKERKENTISKSEEICVSNQNEIVLKNFKLIFSSESIAGELILLWLPGFGL